MANTNTAAQTAPEIHVEGLTLLKETSQVGTWVADYVRKEGRFVTKVRVLVALENGKVDEHLGLDELPKHSIKGSLTGLGTLVFKFD
jgi:hypothetical protein